MHQETNLNKLRRGRSIESNGRRESMENIQLRRSNSPVCRRREQRLTRISLTIVWLFLFCQFWKLVPTVYELCYGDDFWPEWALFVKHLSHALIVLNSSLNFLIYLLLWTKESTLKYFQQLKRETIFSKLWSKKSGVVKLRGNDCLSNIWPKYILLGSLKIFKQSAEQGAETDQ